MYYKLVLLMMLSTLSLSAQDYKEMVWTALKELNVLEKPEGNNRYHFRYKVQSLFKDKRKHSKVESTVETIVAKDRIMIKSDKVDYYQDTQYTFTIVKEEGKIFWGESIGAQWKNQDFTGFSNFKKAFFDDAEYSRVQRKDEPEGVFLLKMLPSLEIRKKSTTDYVLIELNTNTKKVTRMLVMYNAASEQKLTEYIYEKMDLKSSSSIAKNVQDYVMTNSKQLKSAYKGFEVIDIRKESRNKK
jgi:hypothetical protein